MRVGIFDSGVGGLTVLKELIMNAPNNEYIYVGDTKNMPFGNKNNKLLLEYSTNIIDFLLDKKVDIIVIACGTICSTVYESLCSKYEIKLVNIVYEAIDYIKNSNFKNLLILGTPNTIKNNVFGKKLNMNLYLQACKELARNVEDDSLKKYDNLSKYIDKYDGKNIDLIIFGCTHYAVFEDYIKYKYGYNTLNMGYPVAKKMKSNGEFSIEIYYTLLDNKVINNTQKILGIKCEIKEIDIEGGSNEKKCVDNIWVAIS